MFTLYLLTRPAWWAMHLASTGRRRAGSAAVHLGPAALALWGAWWASHVAWAGVSAFAAIPYRQAMAPAGVVIIGAFLLSLLVLVDLSCALAVELAAWSTALLLLAGPARTRMARLAARFDTTTGSCTTRIRPAGPAIRVDALGGTSPDPGTGVEADRER